MKSYDLCQMSVRNLWRRKLRAALTVLGVIIGTASIIMMFSLSEAMNVNYENQMNQWGELSLIEVTQKDDMDGLVDVTALDDEALALLESLDGVEKVMPTIETSATLTIGDYGTMKPMTIVGYEGDELEALGYMPEEGRNYTEGEENVMVVGGNLMDYLVKKGEDLSKKNATSSSSRGSTSKGMSKGSGKMPSMGMMPSMGGLSGGSFPPMMGGDFSEMLEGFVGSDPMAIFEQVKNKLFGETEKVDIFNERTMITFDSFNFRMGQEKSSGGQASEATQETKVKPITVEIVGQLPSGNPETDNKVFVPRETVLHLTRQKELQDARNQGRTPDIDPIQSYEKVIVKVEDLEQVEHLRTQIGMIGFETEGAQDTLEEMKSMSANIQTILLAVGGISLVVAAIGITNTMMTSIYERTKEIGVMKVIGASIADIKKIFLVEAAIIGGVGGMIGISLCYLLSFLLNTYGKDFFGSLVATSAEYETYVSIITPSLAIGAIIFSAAIGIISGYIPAKKATALSALSAMKN